MTLPYENATSGSGALDEIRKVLTRFGCSRFGTMTDNELGELLVQFTYRTRDVTVDRERVRVTARVTRRRDARAGAEHRDVLDADEPRGTQCRRPRVERDGEEPDSKPYMRVQYPTAHGYVDRKWPIPDRETGALKRLAKILHACNERRFIDDALGAAYPNMQDLKFYIQGDPRGAARAAGCWVAGQC